MKSNSCNELLFPKVAEKILTNLCLSIDSEAKAKRLKKQLKVAEIRRK